MANIQRRDNGRYRARYRDDTGRERSKHFDRKLDAQRWLSEVTAALVTGQYVSPDAGKMTLREYATHWEGQQVTGSATARINDNALRLHILPVLGDKPLRSVLRSDVQSLVKLLSGTMSPGSVRNIYEVLNRIFEAAVWDKLLVNSPCQRIALPKQADDEVHPPSIDQVRALAESIEPRYRAAVTLLAGSGLRIGELLGLGVSDVDVQLGTLRVRRQRLQSGRTAPPKSTKSARTVPLAPVVVEDIERHLAAYPSSSWLFTEGLGRPVPYWLWKRVWGRAATTAEVDASGMTTHDLRHFYASALIAGGASVKQVQTVLGHSSATITLRVYSHLWPGDEDRTRSIIESNLGIMRTECGPDDHGSPIAAAQGA